MSAPTITEFLLARIAEDEALARSPRAWDQVTGEWVPIPEGPGLRFLAEREAKRRIVERHTACDDGPFGDPCDDLRYLASMYADHPDFDPSWRPS